MMTKYLIDLYDGFQEGEYLYGGPCKMRNLPESINKKVPCVKCSPGIFRTHLKSESIFQSMLFSKTNTERGLGSTVLRYILGNMRGQFQANFPNYDWSVTSTKYFPI